MIGRPKGIPCSIETRRKIGLAMLKRWAEQKEKQKQSQGQEVNKP